MTFLSAALNYGAFSSDIRKKVEHIAAALTEALADTIRESAPDISEEKFNSLLQGINVDLVCVVDGPPGSATQGECEHCAALQAPCHPWKVAPMAMETTAVLQCRRCERSKRRSTAWEEPGEASQGAPRAHRQGARSSSQFWCPSDAGDTGKYRQSLKKTRRSQCALHQLVPGGRPHGARLCR